MSYVGWPEKLYKWLEEQLLPHPRWMNWSSEGCQTSWVRIGLYLNQEPAANDAPPKEAA